MKTVEYFGEADLYRVTWNIENPIGGANCTRHGRIH